MENCICSHLGEAVMRVLFWLRWLMYLVAATLTALELFLALFQIVQPAVCHGLNCTSPWEKEMATHCSILVKRIPWTEEPGGLLSIASHRVRHDWSDLACMHTCIGEGNDNPLQYSCLEILRDRGAWWAAVYGLAQSRTRLKRLSSSSSTSPHSYVTVLGMCARSVVSDSLLPVDYGPPGSSVHGIFQALEWVTISFSRGSSRPRVQTHVPVSSALVGRFFATAPPDSIGR